MSKINLAIVLCIFSILLFTIYVEAQRNVRTGEVYPFGQDTSLGQYSKFNGPVKGLPHGHGGGRWGAADCLLCGR